MQYTAETAFRTNKLKRKQYAEFGKYSLTLVHKRFGTWRQALAAANLLNAPQGPHFSDKDLLDDLKRVAAQLGTATISVNTYKKHGKYHPCTFQSRFEGWIDALYMAGLSYKPRWNAETRSPSKFLRRQVLDRDGHKCVFCGKSDKLHVDHIIPYSISKLTAIRNLQTLCAECNMRKKNSLYFEKVGFTCPNCNIKISPKASPFL